MTYDALRILCKNEQLDKLPISIPLGLRLTLLGDMNEFKVRQKAMNECRQMSVTKSQDVSLTQVIGRVNNPFQSSPIRIRSVSPEPLTQFQLAERPSPRRRTSVVPPSSPPVRSVAGGIDSAAESELEEEHESEQELEQEVVQDSIFTQEERVFSDENEETESEDEYLKHTKPVHRLGMTHS